MNKLVHSRTKRQSTCMFSGGLSPIVDTEPDFLVDLGEDVNQTLVFHDRAKKKSPPRDVICPEGFLVDVTAPESPCLRRPKPRVGQPLLLRDRDVKKKRSINSNHIRLELSALDSDVEESFLLGGKELMDAELLVPSSPSPPNSPKTTRLVGSPVRYEKNIFDEAEKLILNLKENSPPDESMLLVPDESLLSVPESPMLRQGTFTVETPRGKQMKAKMDARLSTGKMNTKSTATGRGGCQQKLNFKHNKSPAAPRVTRRSVTSTQMAQSHRTPNMRQSVDSRSMRQSLDTRSSPFCGNTPNTLTRKPPVNTSNRVSLLSRASKPATPVTNVDRKPVSRRSMDTHKVTPLRRSVCVPAATTTAASSAFKLRQMSHREPPSAKKTPAKPATGGAYSPTYDALIGQASAKKIAASRQSAAKPLKATVPVNAMVKMCSDSEKASFTMGSARKLNMKAGAVGSPMVAPSYSKPAARRSIVMPSASPQIRMPLKTSSTVNTRAQIPPAARSSLRLKPRMSTGLKENKL